MNTHSKRRYSLVRNELAVTLLKKQIIELQIWIHSMVEEFPDQFPVEKQNDKRKSDEQDYGIDSETQLFFDELANGIVLCRLVTSVSSKILKSYKPFPFHKKAVAHSFKARDNLSMFINNVHELGVPQSSLFRPDDLVKGNNYKQVIGTLLFLFRIYQDKKKDASNIESEKPLFNEKRIQNDNELSQEAPNILSETTGVVYQVKDLGGKPLNESKKSPNLEENHHKSSKDTTKDQSVETNRKVDLLNNSSVNEVKINSINTENPFSVPTVVSYQSNNFETIQNQSNLEDNMIRPPPLQLRKKNSSFNDNMYHERIASMITDNLKLQSSSPSPYISPNITPITIRSNSGRISTTSDSVSIDAQEFQSIYIASNRQEIQRALKMSIFQPPTERESRAFSSGNIDNKLSFASDNIDIKRRKVVSEFIVSENSYVSTLEHIVKVILTPLKEKKSYLGITDDDINSIFANIEPLYNFHIMFLEGLKKNANIPAVICSFAPFLKMYTHYVNSYSNALNSMNTLKLNKKFSKFLSDVRKFGSFDLNGYLINPVQRIPRYLLLLKELKKFTPIEHSETSLLDKAIDLISNITLHINESRREAENLTKILEIQNRLKGECPSLFNAGRRFIREGVVLLLVHGTFSSSLRPRLFLLFSDIILWSNVSLQYKNHMSLLRISSVRQEVSRGPTAFSLSGFDHLDTSLNLHCSCETQTLRDDWIAAFQNALQELRQNLQSYSSFKERSKKLTLLKD